MKYLILCLAAGGIAIAAAAPASASSSDQPAAATPKKEKKVCRERMRSGSHLSNITCKTPDEWARLQAETDDQDEYGIPGNKVATGRMIDRGPPRSGPPR